MAGRVALRARFLQPAFPEMPMAIPLRSGLVHAQCQEDIIFLDLRQDRYFALPRGQRDAFQAIIDHNEPGAVSKTNLGFLFAPRKSDVHPTECGSPWPADISISDRLSSSAGAPGLRTLACAFGFRATAGIWLRIGRLDRIVAHLQRIKAQVIQRTARPDDPAVIAAAFERVRPFFPIEDRCLSNALALMMGLLQRHVPATMVIGVRTAPFSAHSWVQIGDRLVNEDFEVARRFTPILVI